MRRNENFDMMIVVSQDVMTVTMVLVNEMREKISGDDERLSSQP